MANATSLVLTRKEVVPGTAVVPAVATHAKLVQNYTVQPLNSTLLRSPTDKGFPGRNPGKVVKIHSAHSFEVTLTGGGAPGTPAQWADLLNMAMFADPVVTAGVSVGYPLATAGDGGSNSFYGVKDTIAHRGFGARGNVAFSFVEGAIPLLKFDLLALILGNVPAATIDKTGLVLPTPPVGEEVNLFNTSIAIGGYVLGCRSFDLDMGMKTRLYSTTGSRAIIFDKADDGDRRAAGGTVVAELPDLATKNYFDAVLAGTPLPLALTHGIQAGNIVELASPGLVPEGLTYSEESNRLFLNMPFGLVPTVAGNELTLTTR